MTILRIRSILYLKFGVQSEPLWQEKRREVHVLEYVVCIRKKVKWIQTRIVERRKDQIWGIGNGHVI
jgi:hypothetical protein